jgi:hypothetical protein
MILALAFLFGLQDAAPAAASPRACPSIPAGTVLNIAVIDNVGSRKARSGDAFRIALADALVIDEKEVIPAGTQGMGEVIQASHPTFLHTDAGELILAARYLELEGQRLPLRGFRIIANGIRYINFLPQVSEHVENVEVPAGSTATAKVAGPCVAMPDAPIAAAK